MENDVLQLAIGIQSLCNTQRIRIIGISNVVHSLSRSDVWPLMVGDVGHIIDNSKIHSN